MSTHSPERLRVAASYDGVAAEYARRLADELEHKPFDRALLDRFAAEVRGTGPVADVGCGPGHVAAYLHARGVDATGVDLSPGMVAEARRRHPDIPFAVGDVTALDVPDESWAGALAFYSLIHLPRPEVTTALRELRRVVRPGGPLLVAFHIVPEVQHPAEVRHLDELWGLPVSLDFVFFAPEEMRDYLEAAGFDVERCTERDPYPDVEAQTRRCYLVARRPPEPRA